MACRLRLWLGHAPFLHHLWQRSLFGEAYLVGCMAKTKDDDLLNTFLVSHHQGARRRRYLGTTSGKENLQVAPVARHERTT